MPLLTLFAEAASLFHQVTQLPMACAGHRDEEKKVKEESRLHTEKGSDKTSRIIIRATINF